MNGNKEKYIVNLLITLIFITLWVFLSLWPWFAKGSFLFDDIITNLTYFINKKINKFPPDYFKHLLVVKIDETTLTNTDNPNNPSSLSRENFARLINKIAKHKPKVIAIDFVFKISNEKEDALLINSLKNVPNILLAYQIGGLNREQDSRRVEPNKDISKTVGRDGLGFVDLNGGRDAIVRRTIPFDRRKKDEYTNEIEDVFSFRTMAAAKFFNYQPKFVDSDNSIFISETNAIPLSRNIFDGVYTVPISYQVNTADFYREGLIVSAWEGLEDKITSEKIKDRIVLIGDFVALNHDKVRTPLEIMPGVIMNAIVIGSYIDQQTLKEIDFLEVFLFLVLACILITCLNQRLSLRKAIILYAVYLFSFISSLAFLKNKGYILPDYASFSCFSLIVYTSACFAVPHFMSYIRRIHRTSKLKELAIRDQMTGLYTYRYFINVLSSVQFLTKSRKGDEGLLILTIDNLTDLNLELEFEELLHFIKHFIKEVKDSTSSFLQWFRLSENTFVGLTTKKRILKKEKEIIADMVSHINQKIFPAKSGKTFKFRLYGMLSPLNKKFIESFQLSEEIRKFILDFSEKEGKSLIDFKSIAHELECKFVEAERGSFEEDNIGLIREEFEGRNKELKDTLKKLKESQKATEEAYFKVILTLVGALEEKDIYTKGHSERVAFYSQKLAEAAGLHKERQEIVRRAALLHDIGKIGLPDSILNKKGCLNEDEFNFVKKHEIMSAEILKPIEAFAPLISPILHHHEKYDGTGYPYGLAGDMIPIEAQIISIADVYDALTTGRSYKKALAKNDVFQEILEGNGTQFNPKLTEIFCSILSTGIK
ncbi:MAG: HD domain-containing phosphohydrolase, partial [bacterium]